MLELLPAVAAAAAALSYLSAVRTSRCPGWPRRRTAFWLAGLLAAVVATVGPLAEAAHHEFWAHVVTHLLMAMAAPLLLLLAAPITLALRSLPVAAGRRLSRALRTRGVRVLTEPLVAGVINLGGLCLLYRTGLLAASQHHQLLHAAVHTHMFLAGTLFTVAIVGVDPMPHRRSFTHRAAVLVAAAAAHAILAKSLYADPPAGVISSAAETAAVIMYYGGDVVEIAMMVVLCSAWYRSRIRVTHRARIPSASRSPGPPRGRSEL